MPNLSLYKKMHGAISTNGMAHQKESEMVMEATWWNDIASRVAYLYDWYHDDNKTQLNDFDSPHDPKKIPIDIKYVQHSTQTLDKDTVSYHLQLRPSQKCNVPYYDEFFGKRYDATFPCGLYIDIPDVNGIFNRWLIVAPANGNAMQFPTYELLRCDHIFQWVYDGIKFNVPGVLRSQNSYNSGLWEAYRTTDPEDQQKFIVPMNRDTEHLFYNKGTVNNVPFRMIIDAKVETEPRCWLISKINRISSNGLVMTTLAQDRFDPIHDYIEYDKHGNIIGMWADFYSTDVTPVDIEETVPVSNIHSEITYSGTKAEIRAMGSYKKFTVQFFDRENQITHRTGTWDYYVYDPEDLTGTITNASSIVSLKTNLDSSDVDINQIKVKFDGDMSYVGKIFRIQYTSTDGITSYLDIDIKA